MPAEEDGASAPGGTLLLVFIQVASRCLTFAGNQFLLRFLSPSLLGVAVQLELVSVTSLYFARESLRVALQRRPIISTRTSDSRRTDHTRDDQGQTVVNLSYVAVLFGFFTSIVFGYSYLQNAQVEALESPFYAVAFKFYAAATLIELVAEPCFIVIQHRALFAERARAETLGAVARGICACLTAVVCRRQGMKPSILPFAIGQAAYAVVLFIMYLIPTIRVSRSNGFSLTPRPVSTSDEYALSLFSKPIATLAGTMYLQSVFKIFLTQGDALILSFLSSLSEQGAFALASNYGGLLARLVFQPVEESSRNQFGRLLSPTEAVHDRKRGETVQIPPANVTAALSYLTTTIHAYLLFSLPVLALAPSTLPIVVPILLPAKFTDGSMLTLLSVYVYLVPLTALNGILDAFVTSVATPAQLRTQSLWMLAFTGGYSAAAYILLEKFHLGAAGLVGANMVNMAMRIVWSMWFIRRWIAVHGQQHSARPGQSLAKDALPSLLAMTTAAIVALGLHNVPRVATDASPGVLDLQRLGYVVAGAAVLGSTLLISERQFLLEMAQSIVPQRILDRVPGMQKTQKRR